MRRFILGLVVVLFAAGGVGPLQAQELQILSKGNVVGFTEWTPPEGDECYESNIGCIWNKSIAVLDVTTGNASVLSGCPDVECANLVGEGPWPFNTRSAISGFNSVEVIGVTGGQIIVVGTSEDLRENPAEYLSPIGIPECDDMSQAVDEADFVYCEFAMAIDSITGDRTVIYASQYTSEGGSVEPGELVFSEAVVVGSGIPWLYGTAVVEVENQIPFIPAGIPLPQWLGLLVVGFLFGVFYMKGKYDGRVAA